MSASKHTTMLSVQGKSKRLSKGRILAWKQCPKRLYLEVNHPELLVENAEVTFRYEIGLEVGRVARSLEAGGFLIGGEDFRDLDLALHQTEERLADPECPPLFEATFAYSDALIRADIVVPSKDGLLLREVKSASSVKPHYLPDCAVQAWVMSQAGYAPNRIELAHIDSSFVYEMPGQYDGLIACKDITDKVAVFEELVPQWVEGARETLLGPMPDIEPGMQCSEPFACPFMDHCWHAAPEYPVTTLPRKGKVVDELLERGIDDIRDIPEGVLTSAAHQRVREVVISGKPFMDPQAKTVLGHLPYPRYYLDFETIQFTVPIWLGTRPFEQLPFQWSCHIEQLSGEIEHAAFLDTSGAPPMRAMTEKLLHTLGSEGTIFMYSNFERRVIIDQARRFPDLATALLGLLDRLYDLQKLVEKSYYHPAMKGSWSIKTVLPTIDPDLDYKLLKEVSGGTEAQIAYLKCIDPATNDHRKKELESSLLRYCEIDTEGMVKIVRFLENVD